MHPNILLAALAAPVALAVPTPSLFGDIIAAEANAFNQIANTIKTVVTKPLSDIASIVSALGTTLATNGASHGSVWNYNAISVVETILSDIRHSHPVSWPKQVSWMNWSTYKANGVNLGAWLEQ
jgi:hypothetical protein